MAAITLEQLKEVVVHLSDKEFEDRFSAMIKADILEALSKLSPEERREIRAKLNQLDDEEWFDNGELSEQEKAIIEARLDEYDRNPEGGSSWEEARARVLAGLRSK